MALQANLYTSSAVVNGQLVPAARTQNFFPLAVGPVIQGVPAGPQQSAGNGYSGSGQTDLLAQQAASSPFNFFLSPVPLMIIMLIVGFLLLRYIHYPY